MNKVETILTEILACDAAALTPPSILLRDIDGWDSLKHVMLVVRIEQDFAVSLSAEDIKAMASVADVVRVLQEKGADV